MAGKRKQPPTEVRLAIWEAWDKKSAYTGELVTWTQLEIDHVIPITKPELIDELHAKGLLSVDFDINGFENLLPSINFQNSRKSAKQMGESALVYYLDLARNKKPEIEKLLAALLKSNDEIKTYLALKVASEKNDVSPEEMVSVFAHQFDGIVTLRITPEIEGEHSASANSSVAAVLMDKPFALGGGTISEVILHSANGDSFTCRTSNEFISAQELGCYPQTQTEMKIASMANETTEALRAIRDSVFAEKSALRLPIVKLKHFDHWAAEWVTEGLFEPEDIEGAADLLTVADLVNAGICEVESVGEHEAKFIVHNGFDVMMRESMRADLDGDKWEEILVFHYLSAARAGGSFGGGQAVMAKILDDGLLHMKAYPPAKERKTD